MLTPQQAIILNALSDKSPTSIESIQLMQAVYTIHHNAVNALLRKGLIEGGYENMSITHRGKLITQAKKLIDLCL